MIERVLDIVTGRELTMKKNQHLQDNQEKNEPRAMLTR
jgi:hypothetical protein